MKMNLMNDQLEMVVLNVRIIILLNSQINDFEKNHEYEIDFIGLYSSKFYRIQIHNSLLVFLVLLLFVCNLQWQLFN
jgi:hypothetical protein